MKPLKRRRKKDYPPITWSESKKLFRATLPTSEFRAKRKDVYGDSEDEVMDKIDLIEADEKYGVSGATTLASLAYKWFKLKIIGLAPKSKEAYSNALTNHILPLLGNLPISEIKPLHIDELMGTLDGKSSSLRSKVLGTIRQIMEMALENDLIAKNPCRNKKAGGKKAKEKVPLTEAQQEQLVAAVKGTRAELFVLLCLYAGLRREEALGILWSNVHLGDIPYISVRHTLTFDDKDIAEHSEKLKSDAARRDIPIPPQLADALQKAREQTGSMFVIYSKPTLKHLTKGAFRRMWKGVSGYAYTYKNSKGERVARVVPSIVDFYVHPHLLRHTYITELCASGMPIKEVQYLAGHSTVQMTLDIYAHVKDNRPEALAPAIISAFSAGKTAGSEELKAAK